MKITRESVTRAVLDNLVLVPSDDIERLIKISEHTTVSTTKELAEWCHIAGVELEPELRRALMAGPREQCHSSKLDTHNDEDRDDESTCCSSSDDDGEDEEKKKMDPIVNQSRSNTTQHRLRTPFRQTRRVEKSSMDTKWESQYDWAAIVDAAMNGLEAVRVEPRVSSEEFSDRYEVYVRLPRGLSAQSIKVSLNDDECSLVLNSRKKTSRELRRVALSRTRAHARAMPRMSKAEAVSLARNIVEELAAREGWQEMELYEELQLPRQVDLRNISRSDHRYGISLTIPKLIGYTHRRHPAQQRYRQAKHPLYGHYPQETFNGGPYSPLWAW